MISLYSLVENEITDKGAIAFAEYLSTTTTMIEMRYKMGGGVIM